MVEMRSSQKKKLHRYCLFADAFAACKTAGSQDSYDIMYAERRDSQDAAKPDPDPDHPDP